MNAFQNCPNTSDAQALYLPHQLYLKPVARLLITLQLPTQKMIGKAVSNWEVTDQLRTMIRPDTFTHLKVTKTNAEFMRYEAEVEHRDRVQPVVGKLDRKVFRVRDISAPLKVRAVEARSEFPTRHSWDEFFTNARDMNEMKPGERPDTVHLSNLPTEWFLSQRSSAAKRNKEAETESECKPSEKIFYRVFEKFGNIRSIDIPICDPYRHRMKTQITGMQTTSFDNTDYFEGYVQFKDYIGFTKCMDALRNMKLMHKDGQEAVTTNIFVDFDRTKHLSEASIKRREIVRDRMVSKDIEKKDKERETVEKAEREKEQKRQEEIDAKKAKATRRAEREEKRKVRILSQLKVKESDELNARIVAEERKLLEVQRRLEAIRLVEELFRRIKAKKESSPTHSRLRNHSEHRDQLLKMKHDSELDYKAQKEKVNKAVQGRVMLTSILGMPSKSRSSSSDSDKYENTSIRSTERRPERRHQDGPPDYKQSQPSNPPPYHPYDDMEYGGEPSNRYPPQHWLAYNRGVAVGPSRNGQFHRRPMRGLRSLRSNVMFRGGRMGVGVDSTVFEHPAASLQYYTPEMQQQYYHYFQQFYDQARRSVQSVRGGGAPNHRGNRRYNNRSDDRSPSSRSRHRGRSRSRSRSPSNSYSRGGERHRRNRSSSRSRSRSPSSRSRSRSHSRRRRSRSYSNYRNRSRSHRRHRSTSSRSRSRSRSRDRSQQRERIEKQSVRHSRSETPRTPRSRSRKPVSGSRTRGREQDSRSHSKSPTNTRRQKNSRSRSRSVDSSKFRPPVRLDRSKSPSLARQPADDNGSDVVCSH